MILLSVLLLANVGLAGVGVARLNLHFKLRRAEARGDLREVLGYLKQLRALPSTPGGRSLCDIMLLRTGLHLREWDIVEETWENIQSRPQALVSFSELATGSYALSLAQRGRYLAARELLAELPLTTPATGLEEKCRIQTLTIFISVLVRIGSFEEARDLIVQNRERTAADSITRFSLMLIEANIDFQQGHRERSEQILLHLVEECRGVNPFKDDAVKYALVRGLCRCGQTGAAEAVFATDVGPNSTPRLREMRLLAASALAEANGSQEKAMSYYHDLKALQTIDGEAYVRAANLAQRIGNSESAIDFLRAAIALDPESHWARVAQQKLYKIDSPPRESPPW